MCIYIYINITIIIGKGGHGFEGQQGGAIKKDFERGKGRGTWCKFKDKVINEEINKTLKIQKAH